ncbi:MAG: (2Fe-2S)-binding protein, partial [Prevotellaceae bacterium]|nr:(2Fe-2S)-binding protein [Prevotellaceae bacterium]
MQITIDNIPVTVDPNETLLEAARRLGYDIPSLCYAQGAKHKSSCMVCAVRNSVNGQIMPSCTTLPTEGMQIDTQSEAVKQVRTLSLELLLSDHRADCEAPCALVCPKGLEIEQMLSYYDNGELDKAHAVITSAFALPEVGCEGCKAPCEKACRRGNVDQAVSIRAIVQEILTSASPAGTIAPVDTFIRTTDKKVFQSRLGRFTEREKDFLKATVITPSRCLHCACAGRADCRLRRYATDAAIKRSRYEASSVF